jgi:hypothetical protein
MRAAIYWRLSIRTWRVQPERSANMPGLLRSIPYWLYCRRRSCETGVLAKSNHRRNGRARSGTPSDQSGCGRRVHTGRVEYAGRAGRAGEERGRVGGRREIEEADSFGLLISRDATPSHVYYHRHFAEIGPRLACWNTHKTCSARTPLDRCGGSCHFRGPRWIDIRTEESLTAIFPGPYAPLLLLSQHLAPQKQLVYSLEQDRFSLLDGELGAGRRKESRTHRSGQNSKADDLFSSGTRFGGICCSPLLDVARYALLGHIRQSECQDTAYTARMYSSTDSPPTAPSIASVSTVRADPFIEQRYGYPYSSHHSGGLFTASASGSAPPIPPARTSSLHVNHDPSMLAHPRSPGSPSSRRVPSVQVIHPTPTKKKSRPRSTASGDTATAGSPSHRPLSRSSLHSTSASTAQDEATKARAREKGRERQRRKRERDKEAAKKLKAEKVSCDMNGTNK